jgi:hypothetical protein
MADKKPRHTHLLKIQIPDAEPMNYFILFFSDEVIYNIVIETNRHARHKIAELQLTPRSIWSRWSVMSVLEVKAFLSLIINTGLIPFPHIKDYWSSERKTYNFLVT